VLPVREILNFYIQFRINLVLDPDPEPAIISDVTHTRYNIILH
jgi:hypothetical protein